MRFDVKSRRALTQENSELRRRLAKAEEAVRSQQIPPAATPDVDSDLEKIPADRPVPAESPYRALLDQMNEGALRISPGHIILHCNSRFLSMVGKSMTEVRGSSMYEHVVPVQRPLLMDLLNESHSAGSQSQLTLQCSNGQTLDVLVSVARLDTEQRAYGVVISDLTERKMLQETSAAERLWKSIFEASNDPILLVDSEKNICGYNARFLREYKYTEDELLQMNLSHICPPEEYRTVEQYLKVSTMQAGVTFATVHLRKNGTTVPVEVSARPFAHNRRQLFIQIIRDITDRKRTEAAIRASEVRFRSLLEKSWDGIALADINGIWHYASPALKHITGYDPARFVGRNGLVNVHPDDKPLVREVFWFLRSRPGVSVTRIVRFGHANGDWIWLEVTGTNLLNEPSVRAIVVNYRDVTKYKQIEAELRESEQRYHSLFDSLPYPSWVFDEDTLEFLDVNAEAIRQYGYSRQEFLSMKLPDIRPPEELPALQKAIEESRSKERVSSTTWKHRKKDGTIIHVDITSQRIRFGERHARIAVIQDVTLKRRAEKEIRRSEERFRAITELMSDFAYQVHVNPDGSFVYEWLNDAFTRVMGYSVEDMSNGGREKVIHPDDLQKSIEHTLSVTLGSPSISELRYVTKSGEVRWMIEYMRPVWSEQERRVVRIYGAAQDITDRKRDEIEKQRLLRLYENERTKLSNLVSTIPGVVWEARVEPNALEPRVIFISDYIETLLGYRVDEWLSKPNLWSEVIHPDDRETALLRAQEAFEAGGAPRTNQFRWMRKDGRPVWVEAHAVAICDANGTPLGLRGVTFDITHRKQAEDALRASEERFSMFMKHLPGAAWVKDVHGRYAYVNDQFLQNSAKTLEEVIGKTDSELFPDPIVDVFARNDRQVLESGEAIQVVETFPVDQPKFFLVTKFPILGSDDCPISTGGVAIDVTERERAESELRTRARQQKLISDLAQQALDHTTGLDALLARTSRGLRESLSVDIVGVFELTGDGRTLSLQWGVGWQNNVVGTAREEMSDDSLAGRVLSTDAAVIFSDYEGDSRFRRSDLMRSQQIVSGVTVVVHGKERPYGVLGLYTRRPRTFTGQDVHFLQSVVNVLALAIEREQAREQSDGEFRRRIDTLLKEVHHRVKNNMQIISSLLNLQAGYVTDKGTRDILAECQNRIKSIALIHEKIYHSKELSRIDFGQYIRSLATHLVKSYQTRTRDVSLKIKADRVYLEIDTAIPCGLIVNELVSNSFRHAFPLDSSQQKGEVRIQLTSGQKGTITLSVSDNGIGIPHDIEIRRSPSLGLRLIKSLAEQIGAKVQLSGDEGTAWTFSFPSSIGNYPTTDT
jgi:PAS domain S-box-containing protein